MLFASSDPDPTNYVNEKVFLHQCVWLSLTSGSAPCTHFVLSSLSRCSGRCRHGIQPSAEPKPSWPALKPPPKQPAAAMDHPGALGSTRCGCRWGMPPPPRWSSAWSLRTSGSSCRRWRLSPALQRRQKSPPPQPTGNSTAAKGTNQYTLRKSGQHF